MTLLTLLTICALVCAIVPAAVFLRNLRLYTLPPDPAVLESVSILIPARNEQRSIESCLRAGLCSEGVDFEIIVLDDHSEDETAAIVREIARTDPRIVLASSPPMPAGWCGKQFACFVLAGLAKNPLLCFVDADVRLQRDGVARMIAALRASRASLISGFPREITVTPFEQLLLPLMHFLLLGFLPLDRMRDSLKPAFGAGCGQLFLANREAYQRAAGHAAIRASRHDGLMLPRAFRRAGFKTDLCDATGVASCRMYHSAGEVVTGLLKNATEGLGAPKNILPFSILLTLGQIAPVILLFYIGYHRVSTALLIAIFAATAASYLPRLIAAFRFRQPLLAALLHPLAILILLSIQWVALFQRLLNIPVSWKGRTYSIY
ncbi:MAG: glycosyltransferase [Acidobacteriaceae bacterium]|nr:glycosyltransferase [Acidobacteriaceae bacterium]